ncbi:uncharacterized protein LTR77_008755 [Saxophila tyrrhenica]|uniref:Uncharacterized protein n=1 Tax=Saxophila tyrrhenica TaxID=1690608 RepID=A0AAV9P0K2_9PEZI|nr:hypothetical protein LTR77_008755 [Saxophila tyrrhenica]
MPYSINGKINSRSRAQTRPAAIKLNVRSGTFRFAQKTRTRVTIRSVTGLDVVGELRFDSLDSRKYIVLYDVFVLVWGEVVTTRPLKAVRLDRKKHVTGVFVDKKKVDSLNRRLEARIRHRKAFEKRLLIDEDWENIMICSGCSEAEAKDDLLLWR